MKTIARMLLKSCPRCHGDLALDEYERHETGLVRYECLQCGRPTRVDALAELRLPVAA